MSHKIKSGDRRGSRAPCSRPSDDARHSLATPELDL
jgi:hypothetical protein